MAQARHFIAATARFSHLKRYLSWRHHVIARLVRQSASEWNMDNAPRLSAALAFYTLLSLSPMVIVVVSVAGFAFGNAAAGGQLASTIHDVVGWQGASAIEAIIHSPHRTHASVIAALLSVLTLLFGASSVLVELRSGLNTIWKVEPGPTRSNMRAVLRIGKERFYSFVLVIVAGCLLLVSVAASAWAGDLSHFLGARVPELWLHFATFFVSYLIVTLLFAAIYRAIPDVTLQWSDVAVGASVTALIFTIGKQFIALYLDKAAFVSTYGAAGSFVVLLAWVYYSAQLFFLGAEFTKVYARQLGSHSGRKLTPAVLRKSRETERQI